MYNTIYNLKIINIQFIISKETDLSARYTYYGRVLFHPYLCLCVYVCILSKYVLKTIITCSYYRLNVYYLFFYDENWFYFPLWRKGGNFSLMCLFTRSMDDYYFRLQDRRDTSVDSQQFLPSFGPLFGHLGHPRPPRLYQEADYLPELTPYLTAASSNRENAMLGSGNFGVITGGTYYSGGETTSLSDPYLYDGNSHGRPHRYVQGQRINPNR